MGRDQAALDIRVHQNVADLPPTLPEDVVDAIRDAAHEALNHMAKHSGTNQAWVTGRGDPHNSDAVTVTITDRGRGFDPRVAVPGMGLNGSIRARMADVVGGVAIDSSPRQGASVELRWPA